MSTPGSGAGAGLVFHQVDLGYRTRLFGAGWKTVLRQVTFAVPSGAALVLGPNGSGKTTVLRGAMGQLAPQSGSIMINGQRPRICKMAYLPQTTEVLPWYRAIDDAALLLAILKIPRARRYAEAKALLEMLRFDAPLDSRNHQLSGGQQQKVALARCLAAANHVDLVVLDEPSRNLDADSKKALIECLRPLGAQSGRPALIATHDVALAEEVPGMRILLNNGSVAQSELNA